MYRSWQYQKFLCPFPVSLRNHNWFVIFYHQSSIYWLEVHTIFQDLHWKVKFIHFSSAFLKGICPSMQMMLLLSTFTPLFFSPLNKVKKWDWGCMAWKGDRKGNGAQKRSTWIGIQWKYLPLLGILLLKRENNNSSSKYFFENLA